MSPQPDHPDVVALPPLLFGGTLIVGLLLNALRPVAWLPRRAMRWLGLPLIGAGLGLGGWAFRTMRRAHTNVDPRQSTTTIVATGPFRYTRNPIYVSMSLVYLGVAALVNAGTALVLLPGILLVIRRGVIDREEHYLERKFGEEYLRYKQQVRRWL